ncbi:hypothetical protein NHX12_027109 [Muraenolepis orangiensis]|uniref:Uncharacterized protein n=1 Tax=Muraenolepis orangiensis TaxID=630683 RepID=A0A9Q0ECY9_9TELE|nr:hypothetical protein NHX12_027109 [Muraenolepis orangiensis]
MGCAVCSHLADMWKVSVSRSGPRGPVELAAYPQKLRGGYHRATGLHYMSSFSDAEDCGGTDDVDSSSSSSSSMDRQAHRIHH